MPGALNYCFGGTCRATATALHPFLALGPSLVTLLLSVSLGLGRKANLARLPIPALAQVSTCPCSSLDPASPPAPNVPSLPAARRPGSKHHSFLIRVSL